MTFARLAADRVGATKMDRPEWITVHPQTGEVYVTLTNNTTRGGTGAAVDAVEPAGEQRVRPHRALERDRLRPGGHHLPLERLRAGGRSAQRGRGQARQHQGRRVRLAGRRVDRRPGRALDPDRHLDERAQRRRLREHRQQHDAGGGSGDRRDPALPDRPARLRGHRRQHDAGRPQHVRQHPAPGRAGARRQQPEQPAAPSAPGRTARASAVPRSATIVIRRTDGGVVGS